MRARSNVQLLFATAVLIGSLALAGCPKRPEVLQAGPAAVGPPASRITCQRSGIFSYLYVPDACTWPATTTL